MEGAGKGMKFNDRELANKVRTLTLEQIQKALEGRESEFKKALILRLAGSILPRLAEISGPEGKPIPIMNVVPTDHSNEENSEAV